MEKKYRLRENKSTKPLRKPLGKPFRKSFSREKDFGKLFLKETKIPEGRMEQTLQALGQFIATVGIPGFLAILILVKTNAKLEKLANNLEALNANILRLIDNRQIQNAIANTIQDSIKKEVAERFWRAGEKQ
jgi:hypothetical protein